MNADKVDGDVLTRILAFSVLLCWTFTWIYLTLNAQRTRPAQENSKRNSPFMPLAFTRIFLNLTFLPTKSEILSM